MFNSSPDIIKANFDGNSFLELILSISISSSLLFFSFKFFFEDISLFWEVFVLISFSFSSSIKSWTFFGDSLDSFFSFSFGSFSDVIISSSFLLLSSILILSLFSSSFSFSFSFSFSSSSSSFSSFLFSPSLLILLSLLLI